MNPVLMVTHNCYDLTRRAINSVLLQDIPVNLVIIDNGSCDEEFRQYLASFNEFLRNVEVLFLGANMGVSKAWNIGLAAAFAESRHALVLNNDLEIPPHFYRTLIESGEQFVTGVSIAPGKEKYWSCGKEIPRDQGTYKSPHPDFSAFMITRECWERVGYFDEDMVFYAQDCDYHVRMHRERIWAGSVNLEFHHHTSSTLRQSSDEEATAIRKQAGLDRDVFRQKYGCEIGTPEYDKLFS